MVIDCGRLSVNIISVPVKSRSVFPDLLPFETKTFRPSQRRARSAIAKFGASCAGGLVVFPQFEIIIGLGMLVLASA